MSFFDVINNSCELNLTPARKRKRKFEEDAIKTTDSATSCFTNAAFSSTPKKILAKRRIQVNNKENENIFPNTGLKLKSKAIHHEETEVMPENPYEVVRKPPKKKIRHLEKVVCFENPALNLELPEKQFNPYEVLRENTAKKATNCFSNPALNLKIQDGSVLCNPFEVQRETQNCEFEKADANLFEISPEVNMQRKPCKYINVPFVPRVGCRIDFKDISNSQLTPSKLLAEKLVFSPKVKVTDASVVDETTLDIGKELDQYQLELENSINEAKLRKTCDFRNDILLTSAESNYKPQIIDVEKKTKFNQKLDGIPEDIENERIMEEDTEKDLNPKDALHSQKGENTTNRQAFLVGTNPFLQDLNLYNQAAESAEVVKIENSEHSCSFGDSVDDSFNFETPVPFVRAYRKPVAPTNVLTISKDSSQSKNSIQSDDLKKSVSVTNVLRKSIRKLLHVHGQVEKKEDKVDSVKNIENEHKNGIMNAIRQSLRRKGSRDLSEKPVTKRCETSIIDSSERTLKLKSDTLQTEYVKIEDLTNENKCNMRKSVRKSTREVLKTVFHKRSEEYDFKK